MTTPRPTPRPRRTDAGAAKPPPPGRGNVSFGKIAEKVGQRIVLFGPGGIGKTTLAMLAPGPIAVYDLDESLPILINQLPDNLDIRPVLATSFQEVRDTLQSPGWDEIRSIVVDTSTKLQEYDTEWVFKNVPHEKGHKISRIEDYGFGKGYTHVYETFLRFLSDLDQHIRTGRNVILVCHNSAEKVPNPNGEDFLQNQPLLQHTSKASIRYRVRDWADHVLCLAYDVAVKDGKGTGSGSRAIYLNEVPHCMAKSRTLEGDIVLQKHSTEIWDQLFGTDDK